jgi:hypothetical protein
MQHTPSLMTRLGVRTAGNLHFVKRETTGLPLEQLPVAVAALIVSA